jgi:hypothetical protein
MSKGKIPTLIVLVILIIGVVIGVFLVKNRQLFRLGASGQEAPKDVRVTNISETTLSVSWTTDAQTQGVVVWGDSQNSLGRTTVSETQSANIHYATITGLESSSSYFFKINSAGEVYDNNGIPWEAQTAADALAPSQPIVISGTLEDASGGSVANALVYVTAGGGTPLSTLSSEEGNWVVAVSNTRTQDLSGYVEIDESRTLVEISVQAGAQGTASALIYPASAKPAPPIVLGQSHDFKNLPPSLESGVPQAQIEVPEGQESSGFDVPEATGIPQTAAVTLESVESGEIVASSQPEFFGEGPPDTVITITVESDPVTDQVTVGEDGEWNWSPPDNLSPGTHQITLSWRDAGGILRTLTRSFVVQAAEEPAFVSTPSATPTTRPSASPSPTSRPTPTTRLSATPTPRPTVTPTPKASPTATPKPTKAPTATPSSLPDAGSTADTLVFGLLGLTLLVFSGLTFALSMNKNRKDG